MLMFGMHHVIWWKECSTDFCMNNTLATSVGKIIGVNSQFPIPISIICNWLNECLNANPEVGLGVKIQLNFNGNFESLCHSKKLKDVEKKLCKLSYRKFLSKTVTKFWNPLKSPIPCIELDVQHQYEDWNRNCCLIPFQNSLMEMELDLIWLNICNLASWNQIKVLNTHNLIVVWL